MQVTKAVGVVDPNNSSTTNLAAGASFIGAAATAQTGGVITVFMHCDQILSLILYIEQSADAVNWDHLLTFPPDLDAILENNSESWSVRSLAPYYRIRVLNNGLVTTTNFRMSTRLAIDGNGAVSFLVDDDGHAIEATQEADGAYHLGVRTTQAVYASTVNSWGSNLPVNAVFVGTLETTLGVAAIQVAMKSDQNAQVIVDQTFDGTNWDVQDTYSYLSASSANSANSWTTQAVGSAYRLRVKNTGTATSTFLRVGAALCPILEAVPRALSSNGNFKVAVDELLPNGFEVGVKATPMGQLRIAETSRLVGAAFGDSPVLDTSFWGSTAVGTGTIVPGNNQAVIRTGTTIGSSGTLFSARSGRYVGGSANFYRAIVEVPAAVGACIKRWGAYSPTDGFFFETNGSDLAVVSRKASVDTRVVSGSFNGAQGNWYALDANAHTYEIYWTNKSAWFSVDGAVLHKATGATAPLVNTNTLPARAVVFNAPANNGNNSLEVRTSTINRLGPLGTDPIYKYIASTGTTICKYGAGKLHRILFHDVSAAAQTITISDSQGNFSPIIGNTVIANQNSFYPFGMEYGAPFYTGLTVVTSAARGITVIYE